MKPDWRLLDDGIHEARHHFAVEEALARLLDEGQTPPTLRLRRVKPAVFVGVHQNTWDEVDVDYCREHDIQIVRRMNGGGAVYHEMGSFCFSAFFPRRMFAQSDQEIYHLFAEPVIRTCADYGIPAHFGGRNDVITCERKIYGSAQFSWYSAFVQSGTFLVNMNFDTMQRSLTPPALKFTDKSARSITERVTSLSRELGQTIDTREVMQRFAQNFSNAMGIQLITGKLSTEESDLAAELYKSKYNTDQWNFGTRLDYGIAVAEKIKEGVLCLSTEMEDRIIKHARISGDILLGQRSFLDAVEKGLSNTSIQQASRVIQDTPLPVYLSESLTRLIEKLEIEVNSTSSKRRKESI